MKRAVFFDRDGTVNYRIAGEYVKKIDQFKFIPDFLDFFKEFSKVPCIKILVTNQQGIGKGIMTEEDLSQVHAYMQNELLQKCGANFDDIYFCPHLKETDSYFRKPNPGMLVKAIEKWEVTTEYSWMIGDSPSDAIAGKSAGVKTLLLGNYLKGEIKEADFIFKNLIIARNFFLANDIFYKECKGFNQA